MLRATFISILVVWGGISSAAAADEVENKPSMKEVIKARVAADAKKKADAAASSAPASPAQPKPKATKPEDPAAPANGAAPAPATELPKVEVRKGKITDVDRQIYEQDQEIAREKEKVKSTETDRALNNSKVAGALSIFGGRSSEASESLAKERVRVMEAERDLLQEISRAKTKEEKLELKKQLNELRTLRRELEKSDR
jgi:hypothetical protein